MQQQCAIAQRNEVAAAARRSVHFSDQASSLAQVRSRLYR